MHPYERMGTLRSSDTKAKTEETLPWVTKSEYGMDFFEAFEKNRDAKRFILFLRKGRRAQRAENFDAISCTL